MRAAATDSARQEDDIQVLLRDVKGLDRSYLREWATALDVEDQLNKLDV